MIIETGHFALILALLVAGVQASLPLAGAAWGVASWMAAGRMAARVQFALIAAAFFALMWAYVTSDFSVLNVVQNSHTDKPLLYKITGVWGNHEGSMLLWVFVLALYGLALSLFGKHLPETLQARALAVQGMISAGFLLFILFTSNPFLRVDPPPLNGEGLNPLLQDPGLAFHPPMLYFGYVGFSMAFSFAIAALLEGRVDASWARWVRPWTLAAWCFLTLGIAMGSWWAYYTLGWGGWWYWDPVENASFIPWLAGTALLHSAIVVERRNTLKGWTIFLAIVTFSFSLIGTFLVRSGVLTSVHSFAADPERGVFILALLTVLIGGAFILFFLRAPAMKGHGALFAPISREGALLLNNMLLATAAGSVLLGTLYPLFIDALGIGKISVGPPFFNIVFVPLMVPLVAAMGIGPMLGWKRGDLAGAMHRLRFAFTATLAAMVAVWIIAGGSWATLAALGGIGLAAWLSAATASEWAWRVHLFRASWGEVARRARDLPRSTYGMTVAHLGVAVVIAGITGSLAWKTESLQIMRPGDTVSIASYRVTLKGVESDVAGPNYIATRADFVASKNGVFAAELRPEHRVFAAPPQPVTDAAIHTNFFSDLYAVIGEADGKGAYMTRIYHNPLVPWIFLGAGVMALGGGISLSDRRLRLGAAKRTYTHSTEPLSPQMIVKRNRVFLLPLTAFAVLAGFLVWRIDLIAQGDTPELVPSVMIGKPAPIFDLPPLFAARTHVTSADLKGKVTLVNFFASWCVPCRAEQPMLLELAKDKLALVGISYQDKSDAARKWLDKSGDPYVAVGMDTRGMTAIDFGVSGVPESFVIDKHGIIRFREAGPLTPEIVREQILPLVAELDK
jgi:cytochrome c-type biogenesis protein CcmF